MWTEESLGLPAGDEVQSLADSGSSKATETSGWRLLCSRLAYCLWLLTGGLVLGLAHGLAFAVCWFSVVGIPMAKVNQTAMWLLVYRPLEIEVYICIKTKK